jgi:hypothetical protein
VTGSLGLGVPLEIAAAAPVHGARRAAGRRGPARRRPRARRGMHCMLSTSGIQYVLSARADAPAPRPRAQASRPPSHAAAGCGPSTHTIQ